MEIGGSLFLDEGTRDVFPAGINLFLGPKWVLGMAEKFYVKGSVGMKWYMHSLPDNYLEHLGTIRIGPEFQYQAFSVENVVFFPSLKIDFAWCTNFDTEGGVAEAFSDDPAYVVAERYLRGWGIGQELGLKAVFKDKWFLRLSYERLQPRFKVLNKTLQGDLGKDFIDRSSKSLDLNTVNLSIGFHMNWD
ncbi:hypothetical protein GCM10023231_27510 [Olivibacter ginsenosidimutans]|uniref:Outer membrane protein beta-barrel domain-containing protein n=2 Tax=Olivibacter ginsenosidimutans TaxID=1176537 RepID=A0ABP9BLR3_9SPHI